MRARRLALLPLLVIAACGDDPSAPPPYEPTGETLLSTSSPTKDEDPTVLLARDGSIVVAWFSDRGANSDIYITRSQNGTTWAAPVRVTTSPDGDFYPNLIQTDDGAFHLVWFRWYALNRGHIWYNRSANALSWDTSNEEQVTAVDSVDDWVPSIAATQDSLRVFFVSRERGGPGATNDIYYASSARGSGEWDDARHFPHNSPVAHDHLPYAAWTGSRLELVWVRHDTSQPVPWADPPPASEIWRAYTSDGVTWSDEYLVTVDPSPTVHVFPQLYRRSGGEWRIAWTTTRTGTPQVVELPVAQIGSYPLGLVENTAVGDGYSHRITRTPVNGLYFGAWVAGPDGAQDIYCRFYQP